MNEEMDRELQTWMDDWRSDVETVSRPTPAQEIRDHVRRRHHQLVWWVTCEVFLGLFFLTFLLHRAITQIDSAEKAAMGLLSFVVVALMAFGVWNWRSALGSSGETTADYFAISLERCRRMQRGVHAGWAALVCEVMIFAPWIWRQLHGDGAAPSWDRAVFAWAFLTGMVTLGVLFIVVLERWVHEEANRLEELRRELSDDVV